MEQIITKEKGNAVALRWLQKATSNDSGRRYNLSGMHVNNGRTEAADGFRIHLAPTPEPLKDVEGIVRIRDGKTLHKTPGRVYPVEEIEGNYPDVDTVDPSRGQDPMARIAVNARYLREALEMPNEKDSVVLTLYGSSFPFTVESGQYKAIVMPMNVGKEESEKIDQRVRGLRELASLVAESSEVPLWLKDKAQELV